MSELESAVSSGSDSRIRDAVDRLESILNAAGSYTSDPDNQQDDGAYDA